MLLDIAEAAHLPQPCEAMLGGGWPVLFLDVVCGVWPDEFGDLEALLRPHAAQFARNAFQRATASSNL